MKIPLYEQIYSYVIEEIHSGRLKPGSRVPSEKELAVQFNVSRITSKKALEKLTAEQVIERMRGKGSFVSAGVTPEQIQDLSSALSQPASTQHNHPIVALLLPDFSESYGQQLVKAVEQRLRECGYALLLLRTNGQQKEEERAIETCLEMGIEGMIIFPVHGEYYNDRLLRLVLDRFPLVLVDRYLKGIPASSVFTDNRSAGYSLAEYLLNQGHRNIAFISPPATGTSTIEDRLQGITAAFASHGLHFTNDHCMDSLYSTLPGAFTPENIQKDIQIIVEFLQQRPEISAVIACEYNIARVLLKALEASGRRVPEDISVACFDSPGDPLNMPQFTHICQDEQLMGRTAVDILVQQIAGESERQQKAIAFQLVEGRSTRTVEDPIKRHC